MFLLLFGYFLLSFSLQFHFLFFFFPFYPFLLLFLLLLFSFQLFSFPLCFLLFSFFLIFLLLQYLFLLLSLPYLFFEFFIFPPHLNFLFLDLFVQVLILLLLLIPCRWIIWIYLAPLLSLNLYELGYHIFSTFYQEFFLFDLRCYLFYDDFLLIFLIQLNEQLFQFGFNGIYLFNSQNFGLLGVCSLIYRLDASFTQQLSGIFFYHISVYRYINFTLIKFNTHRGL